MLPPEHYQSFCPVMTVISHTKTAHRMVAHAFFSNDFMLWVPVLSPILLKGGNRECRHQKQLPVAGCQLPVKRKCRSLHSDAKPFRGVLGRADSGAESQVSSP